jgi:hypothetical protein
MCPRAACSFTAVKMTASQKYGLYFKAPVGKGDLVAIVCSVLDYQIVSFHKPRQN